jgi:hypothetical protein
VHGVERAEEFVQASVPGEGLLHLGRSPSHESGGQGGGVWFGVARRDGHPEDAGQAAHCARTAERVEEAGWGREGPIFQDALEGDRYLGMSRLLLPM